MKPIRYFRVWKIEDSSNKLDGIYYTTISLGTGVFLDTFERTYNRYNPRCIYSLEELYHSPFISIQSTIKDVLDHLPSLKD